MNHSKNDILGWFEGRVHFYPINVFYEDTDFSGLVYHANYLRYFERGRSSFLKLIGVSHSDLWQDRQIAFTIRKFEIEYKAPAKIDDQLLIKTTYNKMTGARLFITQECLKSEIIISQAECEAACISVHGRPTRLWRLSAVQQSGCEGLSDEFYEGVEPLPEAQSMQGRFHSREPSR